MVLRYPINFTAPRGGSLSENERKSRVRDKGESH